MPQIIARDLPLSTPDGLEIWLPGDNRGMALRVLEDGVQAFAGASADGVRRIVIRREPGLDDVLAASFARRLLLGQQLPSCAASLAEYAAQVRSGVPPNDVHAESSLYAFFAAVRRLAGNDLTRPDNMARFRDGWNRLECAVLMAFEAGADPLHTPLLGTHPAFVRERAYLGRDRAAYANDVRKGRRWLIRFPDKTAVSSGLLLTKPESFLHATWCRRDEGAPADSRYSFLALDQGAGHWEFSVDPLDVVSLQPLAEELRELERAGRAGRRDTETWSDGAELAGTLIGAPADGSVIPRETLLGVVRGWLNAEDAPSSSFTARLRSTWRLPRR